VAWGSLLLPGWRLTPPPEDVRAAALLAMPLGGHAGFAGVSVGIRAHLSALPTSSGGTERYTPMIASVLNVQLARQQWDDGRRRVEQTRSDPSAYARLNGQVELVARELRKRVGQTFTLEELAAVYDRAEDWARDLLYAELEEDAPPPETSTVADAAFHYYARGASDFTP
jgi:hypothetical protein